jgi:hypothetical protein
LFSYRNAHACGTAAVGREKALTLTLFVARVLAANDHDLAVTAYDFALVAHGFYRRSYFHDVAPCREDIGYFIRCFAARRFIVSPIFAVLFLTGHRYAFSATDAP